MSKQKPSLIPAGVRVDGEIEGEGDLIVAGHVEGPIRVDGTLVIEEGALVRGHVHVPELSGVRARSHVLERIPFARLPGRSGRLMRIGHRIRKRRRQRPPAPEDAGCAPPEREVDLS